MKQTPAEQRLRALQGDEDMDGMLNISELAAIDLGREALALWRAANAAVDDARSADNLWTSEAAMLVAQEHETDWLHSPMCPWCGNEVTDSPLEDIHGEGDTIIACEGCECLVRIESQTVTTYRAYKAAPDDTDTEATS